MIHSFLLVGQSNMAGRGFIEEAHEINTEHIKVLKNGRWQPMFRPVSSDRHFAGVSLAESFAEKYSLKYNVDVGLICCADGGTTLTQWERGGLLYDNAVNNGKLAERTSTIAGVLWHQGEGDCKKEDYILYEKRLLKIIEGFKKDLNLYDVPFLLGGLGDYLKDCVLDDDLKNYKYVNQALEKVAENTKMTAFVSAGGLSANSDNLHFNSDSLYEFGIRYFNEFEKIRDKNKIFPEKDESGTNNSIISSL